ncbi:MAG: hypothetical protein JO359_09400 [Candidatus Eremiobacteraeota bacterium]|nr:hypothetical protein [Candidatus Eremiobacteraeota bacterium]
MRTGKHQFTKPFDLAVIVLTFVAMIVVKWPLYVILIVFGAISIFAYRPRKEAREQPAV